MVGPRAAISGVRRSFEAWIFPWKILNDVHMTVNIADYAVPIDVNRQVAEIDVEPDHTTITYAHANFTIRQIMLAPKVAGQTGAMVFYEIQAIRPMDLTLSLNPVMQRMWPAASPDRPSPEWIANPKGSGFYILHLDRRSTRRGGDAGSAARYPASLSGGSTFLASAICPALRSW